MSKKLQDKKAQFIAKMTARCPENFRKSVT